MTVSGYVSETPPTHGIRGCQVVWNFAAKNLRTKTKARGKERWQSTTGSTRIIQQRNRSSTPFVRTMQKFPWIKMTFASAGLIGFGYIIMRATVPTPEQTYNAMAPDLRRKVDANRAARLAREAAVQQQAQAQLNDPDAEKPVWAPAGRR
ncbi:hypothetical protein BC835DRAFT_206157 [Cytidiella melzeri]|nr:hypothetical protein BC835DRAFT_206157 [Cytidiella melzeri]